MLLSTHIGLIGQQLERLKASLQRRLHGLLVQAAIAARATERAEAGEAEGEAAGSGEREAHRRVRAPLARGASARAAKQRQTFRVTGWAPLRRRVLSD